MLVPSKFRPCVLAIGLATVLALSACVSLNPPIPAPDASIPAVYPLPDQQAAAGVSAAMLAWPDYFTDPLLQRLIDTALANNRNLRLAALRVAEARAAFRIQRADRFPGIDINAQGGRARVPASLSATGEPVAGGEYRAEVGLSTWEIDLWGRVRSLEEAALQSWLATESARQAVHVALIAEVADGYLGVREIDQRVVIARQTVATREESYRIFRRRSEVGSSSRLELTEVRTLLLQARALLAQLEQDRAIRMNALAQLLGADRGELLALPPLDAGATLVRIRPGLPAELLLNRPDIIAAEQRLRAASANIGAARAAFFPRIALTAGFGTASADLDDLFRGGSRAWSFLPTLSLPIFDGGRLRASLALSEVRRDMAVADYEQTIQTAFREVADALSRVKWRAERLALLRDQQATQHERARLAQLRYDHGSSAYLEVLDAQRDLLDAQQELVQAHRELLSSQVALYAALGGGTQSAPDGQSSVTPAGSSPPASPPLLEVPPPP